MIPNFVLISPWFLEDKSGSITMGKRERAEKAEKRQLTLDQFAELSATTVQCLPRGLSTAQAQYWIRRHAKMTAALEGALIGPLDTEWKLLVAMGDFEKLNGVFEKDYPLEDVGSQPGGETLVANPRPDISIEEYCRGQGLVLAGCRRTFEFFAKDDPVFRREVCRIAAPGTKPKSGWGQALWFQSDYVGPGPLRRTLFAYEADRTTPFLAYKPY